MFDIVHPADVLFFYRPLKALAERGFKVSVASRNKDVTTGLLDDFGIAHHPISTQRSGLHGLALELVSRDVALARLVRADRPALLVGFGGVAISHVGKLFRIPSLAIYDHDTAGIQTRLTWPFISHLMVPEDYAAPVPEGRTTRIRGTKDLSYFHPSAFIPSHDEAIALGLDTARPNVFLRFVKWGANHDLGKSGWTEQQAQAVVDRLAPFAKLHVCAENDLPQAMRPFRWQGDPSRIHHLLGHCTAYIGESCTMACEAIALGVPALYAGADRPGYVEGLARRHLLTIVDPAQRDMLADAAEGLLTGSADFEAHHRAWIKESPDWSEAVVAKILEMLGTKAV